MSDLILFGLIQAATCYLCYAKGKSGTIEAIKQTYMIGHNAGALSVVKQIKLQLEKDLKNEQTTEQV